MAGGEAQLGYGGRGTRTTGLLIGRPGSNANAP
jgi:hypothetical protein